MASRNQKLKLGSYLIKNGFITLEQAQKVIKVQQQNDNGQKQRFGRVAVKLGFITEPMLNKIVMQKERKEFGV